MFSLFFSAMTTRRRIRRSRKQGNEELGFIIGEIWVSDQVRRSNLRPCEVKARSSIETRKYSLWVGGGARKIEGVCYFAIPRGRFDFLAGSFFMFAAFLFSISLLSGILKVLLWLWMGSLDICETVVYRSTRVML